MTLGLDARLGSWSRVPNESAPTRKEAACRPSSKPRSLEASKPRSLEASKPRSLEASKHKKHALVSSTFEARSASQSLPIWQLELQRCVLLFEVDFEMTLPRCVLERGCVAPPYPISQYGAVGRWSPCKFSGDEMNFSSTAL